MLDNLAQYRKEKHMTQNEVAKEAGITRPYYNMIERGLKRPAPEVAKRIAKVLDFDWPIFYAE